MTSTINASTTAGIVQTADTSGVLALQTAGTTAMTINSSQVVNFANQPTGTFAGTGPAFSAYLSTTQSVTTLTWTKVLFDTELFDTNNNFASSKFTPTVAGYYQINLSLLGYTPSSTLYAIYGSIYKNGTAIGGQYFNFSSAQSSTEVCFSTLVYMNGSTDYLEGYAYLSGTSPSLYTDGSQIYQRFNGCLVRAA